MGWVSFITSKENHNCQIFVIKLQVSATFIIANLHFDLQLHVYHEILKICQLKREKVSSTV